MQLVLNVVRDGTGASVVRFKIMKLIFVIVCVIISVFGKATHKPKTTTKIPCEGVHVHGKVHRRHVIMNGINRPYQLAIYNHEHKIFFSYNVGEDTKDTFAIGFVKINDTMVTEINGIKNGFAVAVDEHNKTAYFGGNDGIYADNLEKSHLKHIVKNRDIWDLQIFNHHLYFIQYPSQRLHKYNFHAKNVTLQEHIQEKIYQFAIDGDGDTFITTRDGLFEIKNGTNDRIPYQKGPKVFRAIEVNHKGVAHFCGQSGIYVAHKANHTLIEIASIRNIFGLTFDSEDNIIYSNPHEIVKLLPHDCK